MNVLELATLQPRLLQPLSAAYKGPTQMDEPGKLLGQQFSKCFALFLPKEKKAKVRHRLYDFQSALTVKTACRLQSR